MLAESKVVASRQLRNVQPTNVNVQPTAVEHLGREDTKYYNVQIVRRANETYSALALSTEACCMVLAV